MRILIASAAAIAWVAAGILTLYVGRGIAAFIVAGVLMLLFGKQIFRKEF